MPLPTPLILSVNLGRAAPTEHSDRRVTGIDKRPTDRPVMVSAPGLKGVAGSGLAGDQVCDRRHHGGNDQAVYAYAREDLDRWQAELGKALPNGAFGENLTTSGVDLTVAVAGETWLVGTELLLQLTVPRIPCRTFAGFLGERGWVRRFTETARTGTYLRVLRPGQVRAGDTIEIVDRPDHGVTMQTTFRAMTTRPDLLPLLAVVDTLPEEARELLARRVPVVLDTESS
ncbi:MAG: MOSC domain-containing protein [Actinomycetota bacterium]|nr:MOSC domain-containing protein [Actinomycetota bacterium]